jgi:hypothetical protein
MDSDRRLTEAVGVSSLVGRSCRALAVLALLANGRSAAAQEANPGGEESNVNYAFASQLGAGVYTFSDGTVQVYRVGGGLTLRSAANDGWGIKLQIPLTIGLYAFDLTRVFESDLPDKVGTLALVPELRFELPAADNWQIMPFAAVGVGFDFSADRFNYILSGGARSLATFELGSADLYLGNRLFYSAYTTSAEFGDDFGGLDSGLDARHSLGFSLGSHEVDGGLFAMNYSYLSSPRLVRFDGTPISLDVQWEFGLTLGTMTPLKLLGLTLPRIGISRRVGTGISTFRFVLGGPFT